MLNCFFEPAVLEADCCDSLSRELQIAFELEAILIEGERLCFFSLSLAAVAECVEGHNIAGTMPIDVVELRDCLVEAVVGECEGSRRQSTADACGVGGEIVS